MNLHLGCGPIHLPGFINIDIESSHNPEVQADAVEYMALLLAENTIDNIFTCHMLEHLEYPTATVSFLSHCHRVLKPGGTLRIVVPDLYKVAKKYVDGEDLKDIYAGDFFYYKDCPAERFMYFAREWEHTVLFDEKLLSMLMTEAGFEVHRRDFNESPVECLRGLDRFESESLVMEGIK